jgi:hypothetical protein
MSKYRLRHVHVAEPFRFVTAGGLDVLRECV